MPTYLCLRHFFFNTEIAVDKNTQNTFAYGKPLPTGVKIAIMRG